MKRKTSNSVSSIDDIYCKKQNTEKLWSDEVSSMKERLNEESNSIAALKQFVKYSQEEYDFVEAYLQSSRECKEIFLQFGTDQRPDSSKLTLIWEAFEGVLLWISDQSLESNVKSSGLFIVSKILQNHIKLLYSSLSINSSTDLVKAVLKCMAVMLAQGSAAVAEFVSCFDFSLKGLKFQAKKRIRKQKPDPRTCYVRFMLGFFVFGDVCALLKMLEEKTVDSLKIFAQDLVSLIFDDLHQDSPEVIGAVLNTFLKNVVQDSNLLKKMKILFFSSSTLFKLSILCKHNEKTISVTALQMLELLCTSQKKGICFGIKKEEPFAGKLLNPVLLKFLISVKQQAQQQQQSGLLDLTVKTLKACPDLVAPYINSIDLQMEPKPSEQWWTKIDFAVKVLKNAPNISDIVQTPCELKPFKELFFKILLPSMPKRHYEAGIKNSSIIVSLRTMELLRIVLSRCVNFKELLSSLSFDEDKKSNWIDSLIQSLPDIVAIIKVRQTSGNNNDTEKVSDSNVLNAVELMESSIDCLYLFQVLKPGILSDSGYNICKLLIFNNDDVNATIVSKSFQILLLENSSVRSWLDKKISGSKSFLHLLLKVAIQWKHESDIVKSAKTLFIKVLNITNQFEELSFEITTWLSYLLNWGEPSGCEVFAACCMDLLHDPFALSNYCVEDTCSEEEKLPCSPLSINILNRLLSEGEVRVRDMIDKVIVPVLQLIMVCSKEPKRIVNFISAQTSKNHLNSFFVFSKQWIDLMEKSDLGAINFVKQEDSNVVEMVFKSTLMLSQISLKCEKYINEALQFFVQSQQFFVKEISEMSLQALINHILHLFFNILTVLNNSNLPKFIFNQVSSVLITSFQAILNKILVSGGNITSVLANMIFFQTGVVRKFLMWKDLISDILAFCVKQSAELQMHKFLLFVDGLLEMIFEMRKQLSEVSNMMAAFDILKKLITHLPSSVVLEVLKKITLDLFSEELSAAYICNLNSVLLIVEKSFSFKEFLNDSLGLKKFLYDSFKKKDKEQIKSFLLICKYFPALAVSYKILCKLLKLEEKEFHDAAIVLSKQSVKWVDSMVLQVTHQGFSISNNWICLSTLLSVAFSYKLLTKEQHEVVGNILKLHLEELLNYSSYHGSLEVLIQLQTFLSLDERAQLVKKLVHKLESKENLILYCYMVSGLKDHRKYSSVLLTGAAEMFALAINNIGVREMSFKQLQSILELISELGTEKYLKKLQGVASSWNEFLTIILKHNFSDSDCINLLSTAVSLFYKIKQFQALHVISLKELYEMVISHSKFLEIMRHEGNDKVKGSLVQLLLNLVKLSPDLCSPSFIPILLASYSATLSFCDQKLLSLLNLFEENGVSLSHFQPLSWGTAALDAYRTDQSKHLLKERLFSSFLDQIDSKCLIRTACEFPIYLKLTDNSFKASDLYDPRFFLTLLASFFKPVYFIDCRQFIESGCLSLVFASLSSHDEAIRKLAYYIISQYNDQMESSRFREKNQVIYLLMLLKNSVTNQFMQIPCVWSMLFIQYLYFVFRPGQHMYPILSNCILLKPIINFKEMPFFLPLFNSSSLDHQQERVWLLRLLADSLKDASDFYLYKKYHVFEMAFAYHDSSVCGALDRDAVVALIRSACCIDIAAYDLIKTHSIGSWLHRNLKRSKELERYLNLLYVINQTFTKSKDLSCSPRLYFSEALLISLNGLQICQNLPERTQLDVLCVLSSIVSNPSYFGDMENWIRKEDFLLMLTLVESLVLSPNFVAEDLDKTYSNIVCVIINKEILDMADLARRPWREVKATSNQKHYSSIKELFEITSKKNLDEHSSQLLTFLREINL